MTSKTHVALGLFCGLGVLYAYPTADIYITISGACIGSLMPDLDTAKSEPSQIFPPVSYVVDRFTKHRGFTHSMFPLILIILYFCTKYYPFLVLGVGGMSHNIIDVVTFKIGIRCYSAGENIIYYMLWGVNLAFLIMMIMKSRGVGM